MFSKGWKIFSALSKTWKILSAFSNLAQEKYEESDEEKLEKISELSKFSELSAFSPWPKFKHNFKDTMSPMSLSNDGIVDTEHFLLLCPSFDSQRRDLAGVLALV